MKFAFTLSSEVMEKRRISISSLTYDPVAHENERKNLDNSIWCQGPGACVLCDEENKRALEARKPHTNRVYGTPGPRCAGSPECVWCEKASDF